MKKLICIVLTFLIVLSVGVIGCQQNNTSPSADGQQPSTQKQSVDQQKAHVRFMYWNKEDSLKTLVELINEKLPDIEFEFQFVDTKSFSTVFQTQMAAGEGPDLLTDGTPEDVARGYVMDLTDQPFIERYHENIIKDLSVDGKIYCVPGPSWFGGFFYNKEIFEKYNLSIPKTWDEFMEVCETLKSNGVTPIANPIKNPNFLMHYAVGYVMNDFLRQPEGMQWDINFKAGKVKMDGTWNKYLETWSQMVERGYVTAEDLGKDYDQALDEFAMGKAAMFDSGPWDVNTLEQKNPDLKIDMMPFVGNKSETGWLLGGPGIRFAVNAKTKNPEAVLSIIDLISTPEGQKAYWEDNKGGSSYVKGVTFPMPEIYNGCADVFAQGHIYAPWNYWNSGVYQELGKQLQEYVAGAKTLDEVVKAVDETNQRILEKTQ